MYPMYNKTESDWKALEELKSAVWKEGFDAGRAAGFAAGYEAAQGQPREKIEQAYEQGQKSMLLRKSGVGY